MKSGLLGVPVLALFAWAAAAPAASRAAEVRPVLVAGYDTGGDEIQGVTFTSGKNDSIRANEGFYLGGGVSVLNDAGNIEFQGTLSVKYQGISADNGHITWIRYPLDALIFYRAERFRVGGGMTYVMHPQLEGSGVASSINTTPDNTIGLLLQADYMLGKVGIGLRFTGLDYKMNGSTLKASGAGLSFSVAF